MRVGDVLERRVRWTPQELVDFATLTGDLNPVHHDAAFAAGTRFGGLIAAGGQAVAFLLGLAGSSATTEAAGVGLEFTFTFVGPVRAGEDVLLRWEVVAIEPSERPKGTLVMLAGTVSAGDRTILTASGKTLHVARL